MIPVAGTWAQLLLSLLSGLAVMLTASGLVQAQSRSGAGADPAIRTAIAAGTVVQARPALLTASPSTDSSITVQYVMKGADFPSDGYFCARLQPGLEAWRAIAKSPCLPDAVYDVDLVSQFAMTSATTARETLVVPAAVSLFMQQRLRAKGLSQFYVVRRFAANGDYVAVPVRLSGASALSALTLTRVALSFNQVGSRQPMRVVARDASVGPLSAMVEYQGSGLLKGRWEVVQPGDPQPTPQDLMTEASLSPEQQLLQQRYLEVGRFEQSLHAGRRVDVPGPDPDALPTALPGRYTVLWRPEATPANVSGDARATDALLGGAAAFPMPVLTYYVVEKTGMEPGRHRRATPLALSDMPVHELGQVIVSAPMADASVTMSTLAESTGSILRQQVELPALGMRLGVLQFQDRQQAEQAVGRIKAEHPRLEVDLHARSYGQQTSPPAALPTARHYALAMLGMPRVQDSVSARIGVIDTGLQTGLARQMLAASRVQERSFANPLARPAPAEHGTAVSAAMVGRSIDKGEGQGFSGLAPGASLFQANAMFDDEGFATSNTLALGLAMNWLVSERVDVINMSLASRGDRVLQLLVGRVLDAGIPIVASVGPGESAPALVYPAAYPGVIAVMPVDAARVPSPASARGNYVTIAAPGVDVWLPVAARTAAGSSGVGAYYTGSSFAAPWVTAGVARLKASKAGAAVPAREWGAYLCSLASVWRAPAPVGAGCGVLKLTP